MHKIYSAIGCFALFCLNLHFSLWITCKRPYRSSISRNEYSFACAGRCIVPGGCICDAPVLGGPDKTVVHDSYKFNTMILLLKLCAGIAQSIGLNVTFTWYARIFAKLAKTGSVANANVSEHSSTGWIICNIYDQCNVIQID